MVAAVEAHDTMIAFLLLALPVESVSFLDVAPCFFFFKEWKLTQITAMHALGGNNKFVTLVDKGYSAFSCSSKADYMTVNSAIRIVHRELSELKRTTDTWRIGRFPMIRIIIMLRISHIP